MKKETFADKYGPAIWGTLAIVVILGIMGAMVACSVYHISIADNPVEITIETPVRPATSYMENANNLHPLRKEKETATHEVTVAIPEQIIRESKEAGIEPYVQITFTCQLCDHSEVETLSPPFDRTHELTCNCRSRWFRQSLTVSFVTGTHAFYAGPTSDYKEPETILQYDYPTIKWTDLDFDAETGTLFHEESGMQFTILTDGYHFTDPIDDNRRTHIVPDSSATAPNEGLFEINVTGGKFIAVAYRDIGSVKTVWESYYMTSQEDMDIDLHRFKTRDYGEDYARRAVIFFVRDDQGQYYLLPFTLDQEMLSTANPSPY